MHTRCGDSLGNVRPNYIKRLAKKLVEEMPDAFSEDFDVNKEVIGQYTNLKSKVMRNRIAGYIAKMKEQKRENNALPSET